MNARWWQWPTVLSLDAPAVSIVWLALLGRALGVPLRWPAFFVLGSSVWLAYAADRWIEGWRLGREDVRTPRHSFYQHWRWPTLVVWTVVFACDVAVAVTRLPREEVAAGLVLTVAVATYLLSHQLVHREQRWRAPKEVCIAGLLTCGCAVFLVDAARAAAMAIPLAMFGGLCFANCALISSWERDVDRAHRQSSLALQSRHAKLIPSIPWIVTAAGVSFAIAGGGATRTAAGYSAASALLLAAIDREEQRLGWPLARVLADAALLTPLVFLAWTS